MKKTLIAFAFAFAFVGTLAAQRTTPVRQVAVSSRSIESSSVSKPFVLNFSRKSRTTIYSIPANADYNRVKIHHTSGDVTVASVLQRSNRTVTGILRVGLTSVIKAQRLNLAAISGPRLNFNCEGLVCNCTGDADCNDLFSGTDCGVIAFCDERGCWCFRF